MPNIITRLLELDIRSTLISVWKRFPLSTLIVLVLSALWFYAVNIDERVE
jgi:hypothetical protein